MNTYKLDPNFPAVFLGDTHSVTSLVRVLQQLKGRSVKGLNILHVGDTGLTFSRKKIDGELRYLQQMLSASHSHLYAIRGNHDRREWFDAGMETDNITLIPDYSVLEYQDNRILAVGGGISVDREDRLMDNEPYDETEMTPPPPDFSGYPVCNVVMAHDIPNELFLAHGLEIAANPYAAQYIAADEELSTDVLINRMRLSLVRRKIRPLSWFAGHYHKSFSTEFEGTRYRILLPSEIYTPSPNDYRHHPIHG